ncbi:MAG: hypothetical protein AB7F86_01505 [Bdellovibrionales bacterium]
MNLSLRSALVVGAALIGASIFQNCGQLKSKDYGDRRRDLFENHSIFGNDNVYKSPSALEQMAEANGVINQPATEPSPTPTPGPGPTPTPTPSTEIPVDPVENEKVELPVKRLCDADKGYWWAYNKVSVMQANSGVFFRIVKDGKVLCKIEGIVDDLKLGKLTLPNECLGGLKKDDFMAQLAYTDRSKPIKFQIIALRGAEEVQINDPIKKKSNGAVMQQLDPSWVYMGRNQPGELCDATYSPLFIDMRDTAEYDQKSRLTAPDFGIHFDILGDYPVAPFVAHEKIRISWFNDPKLMFIALPNIQGRVDGINELFGDNTKGPDGDKADHGFAALAKWDGYVPAGESPGYSRTPNGRIDAGDWVYSRLRLWSDKNYNGISEADELKPLSAYGITTLDLRFDASYREMDKYRNEIMFKSDAVQKDGNLKLIFDVWFALPKR